MVQIQSSPSQYQISLFTVLKWITCIRWYLNLVSCWYCFNNPVLFKAMAILYSLFQNNHLFPQELFCVCGALKRARLVNPGMAEVVFVKKEDAITAYKKYNNRCLDGEYEPYMKGWTFLSFSCFVKYFKHFQENRVSNNKKDIYFTRILEYRFL